MKKYEIIYNEVLSQIDNNNINIGESIPSENELSSKFNTSRVTVRKALAMLENNGIIMKQQGKESIVVSNSIKPKTVLLILPNLFKYIFIELIKEIEHTLRENGINLLIACSYNDQKIERDIIRNYLGGVDGIILEPTQTQYTKYIHSNTYNSLTTKPTVCINSKLDNIELPHLILDDCKNMQILTDEVIKRGRKKILILSKTDDLQGFSRLSGITSILENHTEIKYKIVEFTTYNEEKKKDEFAKTYFHFKPDTIMFYNDEYAYKFMNQYNINPIIDDILITGFDDTEYSNGYPYSFLSPYHPKGTMGRDAANMIVDLLKGNKVDSIIYPPKLNLDK